MSSLPSHSPLPARPQRPTPPLTIITLPLVVGIFAANAFTRLWFCPPVVCLSLAAVFLVWVLWAIKSSRHDAMWSRCGVGMASFFIGAALFQHHVATIPPDIDAPHPATYTLLIDKTPKATERSWLVDGRLTSGQYAGRRVRVRLAKGPFAGAAQQKGVPVEPLRPGDLLAFHAAIEPPQSLGNPGEFNYAKFLRQNDLQGSAFCPRQQWRLVSDSVSSISLPVRALRWRSYLVEQYAQHFSDTTLAIVSSLTLGDRTHLRHELREHFAQGGVSHILALSGLHLAILFALFHWLLLRHLWRRWARWCGATVCLLLVWTFVFIAGMPASLVRAAVMLTLLQIGLLCRRNSNPLSSLMVAATVILLVWPQSLFDIGFQLSFLSVWGMLVILPRLRVPQFVAGHRLLAWVYNLFCVTCVCTLITMPLSIYHFHNIPLYGLVANYVAIPFAWLVISLSLIFFILPFARAVTVFLLDGLIRGFADLLAVIAEWPLADTKFYMPEVSVWLIYAAILAAYVAWTRRRLRLWCGTAAVCALVVAVATCAHQATGQTVRPQLVFYHLHHSSPVHFIASARQSYLWMPPSASADSLSLRRVAEDFWQAQGMDQPQRFTDRLSASTIEVKAGTAVFAGRRVAVVSEQLPFAHNLKPLAVDYLLLEKGCSGRLERVLRRYAPRQIVLSAGLSDYHRERYSREARQAGIAVYDLKSQGALVVPLD